MTKHNTKSVFSNQLTFEPLAKRNWNKFVELFGEKGACGNCWCMYYRLKKSDFNEGKINDGNKTAMKDIVWENKPTGLLAFYDGQAIAWCAFAPVKILLNLKIPGSISVLTATLSGPFPVFL